MEPPDSPILFYDGDCGLCARSVQWCLDHDRRGSLRFAPLQGATYAALEVAQKPRDLGTVVLLDSGALRTQSEAMLGMMRHVGGPWPFVATCARIVPRGVRDGLYRFVARRRHALLGGSEGCHLPSAAESARFLA